MPSPFPVNYRNDSYPLLSFAYAVYCGKDKQSTMMVHENALVRKSLEQIAGYVPGTRPTQAQAENPVVYRGYLEYYNTNQVRRFPGASQRVVSVDVIQNDVPLWNPPLNVTAPSPAQCQRYIDELVLELQGVAEPPPVAGESIAVLNPNPPHPARKNAARDDFRPMLSCLAVIFLNDDTGFRQSPSTFLADYELSAGAIAALTAYSQGLMGAAASIPTANIWLTAAQTAALATELVDDMSKPGSAIW